VTGKTLAVHPTGESLSPTKPRYRYATRAFFDPECGGNDTAGTMISTNGPQFVPDESSVGNPRRPWGFGSSRIPVVGRVTTDASLPAVRTAECQALAKI
jgi:hypothetical protein